MKKWEIKKMRKEELLKKLEEIRRELMIVESKKASGASPDNPGKVRHLRKTIARILTEINRREKGKK